MARPDKWRSSAGSPPGVFVRMSLAKKEGAAGGLGGGSPSLSGATEGSADGFGGASRVILRLPITAIPVNPQSSCPPRLAPDLTGCVPQPTTWGVNVRQLVL